MYLQQYAISVVNISSGPPKAQQQHAAATRNLSIPSVSDVSGSRSPHTQVLQKTYTETLKRDLLKDVKSNTGWWYKVRYCMIP
jgi:hypothetical protein